MINQFTIARILMQHGITDSNNQLSSAIEAILREYKKSEEKATSSEREELH
ncbi:hypothetical protein ACRYI5_00930 [Furfurilactobacillus sp. WILCCON 0119]